MSEVHHLCAPTVYILYTHVSRETQATTEVRPNSAARFLLQHVCSRMEIMTLVMPSHCSGTAGLPGHRTGDLTVPANLAGCPCTGGVVLSLPQIPTTE